MKRRRWFSDDGIAHVRRNPQGRVGKAEDGRSSPSHLAKEPRELVELCLKCERKKCTGGCSKYTKLRKQLGGRRVKKE